MNTFLEYIFAFLIIIVVLGLCFLMMYVGFKALYKTLKPHLSKSEYFHDEETKSLKQRVESLERKLDD